VQTDDSKAEPGLQGAAFATTRWSVVLAAGDAVSPKAAEALELLCRIYWYPLYAYVRRRGYGPEDAQDLTQEFLAGLLAKPFLRGVSAEKGRFRSFLLACLNHFLADAWDKARAVRRGGGQLLLSLDASAAEGRYRLEPADSRDAEALYERRWATTLLERVMERLRTEAVSTGRERLFDQLQGVLLGESPKLTYAEVASRLMMGEGAVRMAVCRLRQRYRELLREEIAQTVSRPSEVDEEIRHLRLVLGR
jgi:DNA-directed RNA polymerase specialized sigma24 family protein